MKTIQGITFQTGSREELLPGFSPAFPYLASRAALDQYSGRIAPWHWHKTVELFYMESGTLEYHTPKGRLLFPAGSGGFVNSGVLHMTRALPSREPTIQLLHLFNASLLAGSQGGRIEQAYIAPVISSQLEILPLSPQDPTQSTILEKIREAFSISKEAFGYEISLRNALSEIWLMLLKEARPLLEQAPSGSRGNKKIKEMMTYIHEHYGEKIHISALASSAFLSERVCFRLFQDCLHMTPTAYIKSYRLQKACQMLAQRQDSITRIGYACGLGSTSYFGKVFREELGCTPSEYRQKWQDIDI